MNIIIPIGGLGSRFLETGFTLPKPLISLLFKPILFWLLDCLNLCAGDNVIIICNKRLKQYRFRELINKNYKNITVVYLLKDTDGAAETVLHGLAVADLDRPTLLLDGDTFYNVDVLDLYRNNKNKNVVFSFEQQDSRPIYSYVDVVDNKIKRIEEKNKISNLANTGGYAFSSGRLLKKYCELAIDKFAKSKQIELYTSSIISDMIDDDHVFDCIKLNDSDFEVVGTPLQYKLFQNKHKHDKQYFKNYRICFDLDNTLVTHPDVPGDYNTVQPIDNNIEYARFLHQLGCTVIIYTARRMKTHSGNVGAIMADVGKITFETLKKFNIPCDEIYFGKPYAHAYIDDLAFNAFDDFPSRLGVTDHQVKEREFNTVSSKTMQVFEKMSSDTQKLEGELYWYKSIPDNVRIHTPQILTDSIKSNSYLMEKITGVTFSELLVSQSLSNNIYTKLLETIHTEVHSVYNKDVDVDMYSVYANKIEKRYSEYDYSKFPGADIIYQKILHKLKRYETDDVGVLGIIHGDPVFSNIIADENSDLKFVDPRGLTGTGRFSIYGDVMYDYGKILQSLCGYDEIMLTGELFLDNTNKIKTLYDHVTKIYGEEYIDVIRLIKDSLLFTLIPLHDNDNCDKYLRLIECDE